MLGRIAPVQVPAIAEPGSPFAAIPFACSVFRLVASESATELSWDWNPGMVALTAVRLAPMEPPVSRVTPFAVTIARFAVAADPLLERDCATSPPTNCTPLRYTETAPL